MSALFLTSYVIYHAQVGSVPFKGTGWIRTVYFAVLIPHVILAAAIVPPILITVSRGLVRRSTTSTAASRDGRCRCGCMFRSRA